MNAVERLARLRLVAITDFERATPEQALDRFRTLARAALPASVALDLRERRLPARRLLEIGAALREAARETGQSFVVSDRVDLAVLLAADGVHLGEASVPTADARALAPSAFTLRACHAPDRAGEVDADVVLLSPVLEPRKGNPALGLAALGEARGAIARAASEARLFALGGVDVARAGACLGAGADGVAAIGAAFAPDGALDLLSALGIRA